MLGGSSGSEGGDPGEGAGLVEFEAVAGVSFEEVVVATEGSQVGDVRWSEWVLDDVVVIAHGGTHGAGGCDARGVVGGEVSLQGRAGIVPVLRGCGEPFDVFGQEVFVSLDAEVGRVVSDQGSSRERVDGAEAEQVGHVTAQDRRRVDG